MTGVVLAIPRVKFTLPSGAPAALGWVTVYEAGTTTLANTWQDKLQATLNTNPIHLDGNGECLLWGDSTKTYKILLQDEDLATVSGWPVDNIPGTADIAAAAAAAAAAATAAAAASAADAAQSATDAATAQAATETARDAALAATKIYPNTAAGLAAVASGEYFYVPSADTAESLILYLDNAGVAVEVKRYLAATILTSVLPAGYAWAVVDGSGNAAIGVDNDGTAQLGTAEADDITTTDLAATSMVLAEAFTVDDTADLADVAWAVKDSSGNVALGVESDGTAIAGSMRIDTLNGDTPAKGTVARRGGIYSYQINFVNCTGQSLGEGSTPAVAITTTQEFDNLGFPARSAAPTAFYALTTGDTQIAGRAESPMYGTCGFIKQLIADENGISYSLNDYQLVACNNSYGGTSITGLNKGNAAFTNAMAQVQAAYDIATLQGKTMAFQAVTWTQGESDSGMAQATYKGHLKTLASDFNADGKAITGQHNDVKLITYQCGNASNVALAQLEASNESALIVMACPMYQFTYGDSLHIDSTSAKWLGGYYGLAYKRCIVDGQDWKPLQPIAHTVLGSTIDLIFNKNGLTLDTTLVAAQTNYGFTVKNGAAVAQTISSVAVVAPNRVRLTMSGTPAAGWTVQYGVNAATGRADLYVGGCGNLRDSQGDTITYDSISKTMHNWCVIFDYTI